MNKSGIPQRSNLAMRLDISLCRRFNRYARWRAVHRYFAAVSRLGDGVFWYCLMGLIPFLFGWQYWLASLHMAITAIVALLLYTTLKRRIRRPRPSQRYTDVTVRIPPLDEFSFPSGHTLHAVAFSTVAIAHIPALAFLLLPFTLSVALSRVILGVHYPSDVLAALGIGLLLGKIMLWAGPALGLII